VKPVLEEPRLVDHVAGRVAQVVQCLARRVNSAASAWSPTQPAAADTPA